MKYRIQHHTTYSSAEPVSVGHNEAWLTPRNTATQTVLSHRIEIQPEPSACSTLTDYFGNTVVIDYQKENSNESRIKVEGYLARTQYQGQTAVTADRATTYVPRSTQSQASVNVNGSTPAGRRGFVDWQVRAGADKYIARKVTAHRPNLKWWATGEGHLTGKTRHSAPE